MDAEDLDVVAGVGDHGQVRPDHLLETLGQSGSARAPRQEDALHEKGSPSGSPVILIPEWAL